jgi:hypothetical protein
MKNKSGRHPFKWMLYQDTKVAIDRDIAPLLSKMWSLGIKTTNSCQGHCSFNCNHKTKSSKDKDGITFTRPILTSNCHQFVWLAFDSAKDVERLYNLVAEYSKDNNSTYNRMSCDRFVGGGKFQRPIENWELNFYLDNRGVEGHWGRPKWGNKRSTVLMWVEDECKKNNFVISPQLTFPRKDLSYVEARLQLALDRRKNHVAR